KLIFKEDIVPRDVDQVVYKAAPFVVITTTFLALVVVPFTYGNFAVANLNVGLLYLLAVSSLTVLSIMMAGWGSNNKYSLLGGLRAVAQMISYEVPMILALMAPVILAGSLNLSKIVQAQQNFGPAGWVLWAFLLSPAFIIYIICGNAETNRPPFDLVEGESELIAGFHTEYSGMRFAMFFLAEFVNMLIVACVATVMFLGGWSILPPIDALMNGSVWQPIVGFLVFFAKVSGLILLFMWIRWTFPRLRADQLMGFGWKILLPASFVTLLWATLITIVGSALGVLS
ncbi:MAG: complex I subunit 1/NuoH family protein, partial [Candidatus Xenobia bacterium]